METQLERYSRVHRHFMADDLSPLLVATVGAGPSDVIADLGSGEGRTLWALRERGLLGKRAYAVDLSPLRVAAAEKLGPAVHGIVSDATAIAQLEDASVDGVIASQLIEHVEDQAALAREIARILKPDGWWYVSSCLRGPRAWWIYRVQGSWMLDPTHVREYASEQELLEGLARSDLSVSDVATSPIAYPVVELALRGAARGGLVKPEQLPAMYRRRRLLLHLRRLRVRAPGYRLIEVVGRRSSG